MKRIALGTMLIAVGLTAGAALSVQAADKPASGAAARPMPVGELSRRHAEALGGSHHLHAQLHHQRARGTRGPPTVTQRLLRNQDDIGGAIKPIYGDEAARSWRRCYAITS